MTILTVAGEDLETFRPQLTGYCYRMLGCPAEAQDAVQETMIRAWKGEFEGRSSVRTWLYRIATNVCLDLLRSRKRRARPMDLGPVGTPNLESLGQVQPPESWVLPTPTQALDPAELAESRESVRLAFVAALQHLPPRQRAVLILCEVLRFSAAEVADQWETTTASVNSALQRARATLAEAPPVEPLRLSPDLAALLARYVAAFESYDVAALTALMREDVTMNMPPFPLWLQGPADVATWFTGPGQECAGSRLVATSANGQPAYGQYRVDPAGGHAPWALMVLDVVGSEITGMTYFLDTPALFPAFGLPAHLR